MVGNLGRVSTFGLNDSNIGNIIQTQRQISDLSAQISSGKKASRYEGIADRSNRLVNIENELERTLQYKTNAADVERRLEGMEASMASIINMGTELKADLVLASNPGNADSMPLAELGRAFFEQAAAFLNLEQDNRYVFGGTKTDRPPVASLEEVTAAFRMAQQEGGALDVANLAGKDTVIEDTDENSSVPLRALQIIDFFVNDEETRTINTAYPIRATDSYTRSSPSDPSFPDQDSFRANTNAVSFRDFYYQGDERELSSKIEDNNDLEYGVKANRKGIEKALLAGWILADIGNPTPVDGPAKVVSGGPVAPGALDMGGIPKFPSTNPATPTFGLNVLNADLVTGTRIDGGTAGDFRINGNDPSINLADLDGDGIEMNEIAAAINADPNFPGVTATVREVAVRPTAVTGPVAVGTAVDVDPRAAGAQALPANITINGVTIASTAAAPATTLAAEINASASQTGAQAVVRSNGVAEWLEITNLDGSAPLIESVPGTGLGLGITEAKDVIELRNADGSTPAIEGVNAQALGFVSGPAPGAAANVEGTANTTLDLEDRVEVALKLLEDVLQGFGSDTLSAVRSDIGVDLAKIETVKDRYNAFELFHEEVQVEIENTDIATAATQLSQSQLILESSFLAISSISQLSLANFLR